MRIEFDAPKDASNRRKHGLSLADAAQLDWAAVLATPDTRRDYGERREIGLGPWGNRIYCVVFTRRGEVFRVISFRKANEREVAKYEEAQVR